jgi:predicted small metal-binding protein
MFEFICDRVIPGCEHKETGDTAERTREKAIAHLRGHHHMDYIDDPTLLKVGNAILRRND